MESGHCCFYECVDRMLRVQRAHVLSVHAARTDSDAVIIYWRAID